MGLFTQEQVLQSKCWIFDEAGGMRDQLEQSILQNLQAKRYPLRATIETLKSGGILGTKEQCVVVDIDKGKRVVIANTTVGVYLYVGVYLLGTFLNGGGAIVAEPINDFFAMQQREAVYAAAIAAVESAFVALELKQSNSGYKTISNS